LKKKAIGKNNFSFFSLSVIATSIPISPSGPEYDRIQEEQAFPHRRTHLKMIQFNFALIGALAPIVRIHSKAEKNHAFCSLFRTTEYVAKVAAEAGNALNRHAEKPFLFCFSLSSFFFCCFNLCKILQIQISSRFVELCPKFPCRLAASDPNDRLEWCSLSHRWDKWMSSTRFLVEIFSFKKKDKHNHSFPPAIPPETRVGKNPISDLRISGFDFIRSRIHSNVPYQHAFAGMFLAKEAPKPCH
jgi:hypothetical protein